MKRGIARILLAAVLLCLVLFAACTKPEQAPENQNPSSPAPVNKFITTIGIYRPSKTTFYLHTSNMSGDPEIAISFGQPGNLPVIGDWNGNGTQTIGSYNRNEGAFYLRDNNAPGDADV